MRLRPTRPWSSAPSAAVERTATGGGGWWRWYGAADDGKEAVMHQDPPADRADATLVIADDAEVVHARTSLGGRRDVQR